MLNYLNWDDAFARAVIGLRDETGKPVLVIPAHLALRRPGVNLLTKNGVPAFPTPEKALKTLAAMVKYTEYRRSCSMASRA
jgi:acyl-CoA synthetase (NDP forming)